MKPKDYINKKAQEEALKAFGATQLNNNQESSAYFVGKINADRTKITDPTGKVYDLIFTGNPKQYELAQRLSDNKAVVNAQNNKTINVDGDNFKGLGIYLSSNGTRTVTGGTTPLSPEEVLLQTSDVMLYDFDKGVSVKIINTNEFDLPTTDYLDMSLNSTFTANSDFTWVQFDKSANGLVVAQLVSTITDVEREIFPSQLTQLINTEVDRGFDKICCATNGGFFDVGDQIGFQSTVNLFFSYRYFKNPKVIRENDTFIFSFSDKLEADLIPIHSIRAPECTYTLASYSPKPGESVSVTLLIHGDGSPTCPNSGNSPFSLPGDAVGVISGAPRGVLASSHPSPGLGGPFLPEFFIMNVKGAPYLTFAFSSGVIGSAPYLLKQGRGQSLGVGTCEGMANAGTPFQVDPGFLGDFGNIVLDSPGSADPLFYYVDINLTSGTVLDKTGVPRSSLGLDHAYLPLGGYSPGISSGFKTPNHFIPSGENTLSGVISAGTTTFPGVNPISYFLYTHPAQITGVVDFPNPPGIIGKDIPIGFRVVNQGPEFILESQLVPLPEVWVGSFPRTPVKYINNSILLVYDYFLTDSMLLYKWNSSDQNYRLKKSYQNPPNPIILLDFYINE